MAAAEIHESEMLAAHVAMDTGLARLRGETLLMFQTDATAAPCSILKALGETPAMKCNCRRDGHSLGVRPCSVRARASARTPRFECDALSRISEGTDIPDVLNSVRHGEA